ncbi:STAS domain-containing protein [Thiomonas intermedia]|uniref:STAS domain-containing protein n=1 Tax=Thiomonas intermedia TaxID=926 RepID=UPI0009A52D6B|nr:STAS domain-containing protein [Thiomonas intermedia]
MPLYALPAELTFDSASGVRRLALAALRTQTTPWAVDAGALTHFDSSALALLLELRRAAPQEQLDVRAAPARLSDLAAAYGLEFLFDAAAAHS